MSFPVSARARHRFKNQQAQRYRQNQEDKTERPDEPQSPLEAGELLARPHPEDGLIALVVRTSPLDHFFFLSSVRSITLLAYKFIGE
jgi:hypothetical protein